MRCKNEHRSTIHCNSAQCKKEYRVLHNEMNKTQRVGKPVPWFHIRAPFWRESRVPNVCHRHPEYLLSQSPSQSQCLGNPATRVAVKSCSPLTFPESHTVFWSNRGSRESTSRPRTKYDWTIRELLDSKTRTTMSTRFSQYWVLLILAGKLDSRRHSITSLARMS